MEGRMTIPVIRTIIVDDEPLARRRVRSLLNAEPGFEIIGEAADGLEALKAIAERGPDLVFLDVQMPGLDGLGVASGITIDPAPLIVFVTAFDKFAASAFDLDAADYLLKPYDADRFGAAVSRVRRRLGTGPRAPAPPLDHLVATSAGQMRLLAVGLIERVEAAGNYADVTMAGGATHLVRQSLSAIAEQLPQHFVRVHRSTIIRLDRVVGVEGTGHGDALIALSDGTTAPLSRRYRSTLMDRIAAVRSR